MSPTLLCARVAVVESVRSIANTAALYLRGSRKCYTGLDYATAAGMHSAYRAFRVSARLAAAPLKGAR